MQKIKLSLRTRFVVACLLLVTISSSGYVVVVAQFVELLERTLRDERLRGELEEFADAYRIDPNARGPHSAGLSSFVLPVGADDSDLPEALRRVKRGVHNELDLDGLEVVAGRVDIDGARLYVVLDMMEVEQFEMRFTVIAWLCALASWTAAIVVAQGFARRLMGPIERLAAQVAETDPGSDRALLAPQFGDGEIGVIATAVDRLMERMEAFVARERAFTEDASHELRTPLTVIDSAVQLLDQSPALDELTRLRVQRIQRAVQQMQALIEALLFLAREQDDHPNERIALDGLLADLVDVHRELIGGKPLHLILRSEPAFVLAPRGMVNCVIGNLLSNAIHFTERGDITLQLSPGRLIIQDSGIGIAPDDLDRIFERRFRGAQSRGLGLGLYLVKRISERLDWQVAVSSTPGVGTRFELRFPAV